MKTVLIILGILFTLIIALLSYIGSNSPETFVYLGQEVPKKYMDEIRDLDLLDEGEQIKYFYSDGLMDIKSGFYFVTEQKLVVYSNTWEEPATIIPFGEISYLDAEYNDSFFDDSFIFVETISGMAIEFPVSSEKERDKAFFNFILERSNIEQDSSIMEERVPFEEDSNQ